MNDIIFFITSIRDVGNSDYNFFEKHNHFLMTDVLERTSKRRLTRWTSSDKASALFTIHFIGSIDRSHLYLFREVCPIFHLLFHANICETRRVPDFLRVQLNILFN